MFFCHIQSTHSQIKIFVSPCLAWFLLDEKTSWFPSGLNTGNPSNPEKVVICSKLFPSIPTAHKSKFLPFGSFIFEEKITLLSSVKKYGAKLAPSLFVIFILFYEIQYKRATSLTQSTRVSIIFGSWVVELFNLL